ncbi:hypothetical protein C8Q76DRAFT_802293 [Earliella scabrosa]|nr:hypothetical protein C8Q76DRAFT_802293 [Earliella scabrosa]
MASSDSSEYLHEITGYYGRLWRFPSNCLILSCIGSLADRICGILQDAVVVAITWYRTAGALDYTQAPSPSNPIMFTLLRDGAIYFLFALCINIAGVVTLAEGFTSLGIHVRLLNGVAMSRFMLNLRVAAELSAGMSGMSMSSLHFMSQPFSSRAIGDFGVPVEFVSHPHEEDLEF